MTRLTSPLTRSLLLAAAIVSSAVAPGCASSNSTAPNAYASPGLTTRNPERARELTTEARALIQSEPARARELLEQAIAADLYHGPAHNNLGVLHLEADRLYEAAHEFEWACRLMPGHPDPRLNLGLVFDRAGRFEDALTQYETALEVYPGHIPTTQALVRCKLMHGRADDDTKSMLAKIAVEGETETWREWARSWMHRVPGR